MSRRRRLLGGVTRAGLVGPIAVVVLLASALASPVAAAASGTFTASFQAPAIETTGSTSLTLDVANTGGTQLTWLGVIAPAGYTLTAATGSNGETTVTGSADGASRAIVPNVDIAPGTSGTVTLTVTPPTGCSGTPDQWSVYAESGENLSLTGFPDESSPTSLNSDDFTPWPATPTTTVANACSLAFVNQPTTTVRNASITDAAFSAGIAISVAIVDGQGNTVTSAPATQITLMATGGSGSLAGTTTVTTTGGVATFPGISIGTDGTYALAASATGLTGATSSQFSIVDGGTTCSSGSTCSATATGGTNDSTTLGVQGAAGTAGQLTISFVGSLQCYGLFGRPYVATSATFTVDLTTGGSKIFDVKITKAAAVAAGKPYAFQYHVCFNAPNPFTQLLGRPAVADPVNGGYTGLLPGCWSLLDDSTTGTISGLSNPCVIWKYRALNGDIHIRFFAPAGDPRGYI